MEDRGFGHEHMFARLRPPAQPVRLRVRFSCPFLGPARACPSGVRPRGLNTDSTVATAERDAVRDGAVAQRSGRGAGRHRVVGRGEEDDEVGDDHRDRDPDLGRPPTSAGPGPTSSRRRAARRSRTRTTPVGIGEPRGDLQRPVQGAGEGRVAGDRSRDREERDRDRDPEPADRRDDVHGEHGLVRLAAEAEARLGTGAVEAWSVSWSCRQIVASLSRSRRRTGERFAGYAGGSTRYEWVTPVASPPVASRSQHPCARAHVAVPVDDPELDVEAVEPLVVVDRGPVEEAANVDAARDRVVGDLQAALEVRRADGVVVGADAVLGDQDRRARRPRRGAGRGPGPARRPRCRSRAARSERPAGARPSARSARRASCRRRSRAGRTTRRGRGARSGSRPGRRSTPSRNRPRPAPQLTS